MVKGFPAKLVLLSVVLIAFSCAPVAAPSPPEAKIPPATALTSPPEASWEREWEKVLSEGKKEGTVNIYTTWGSQTRTAVTSAFRDKYGINVEFSPSGRGAELVARVQTEQRAGLYLVDFFGVGSTTAYTVMKPEGLLGNMGPLLVLPEIQEPSLWRGGKLPFLDADKSFIALLATKQRYLGYNTELVKKGEITGYRDVLRPQYKGKITLNDPTVTGIGAALMSHLAVDLWNPKEAEEFLRQLIKQQQVVIQRDNRLHVESVARGKYAIGLGLNADSLSDFLRLGAPLEVVDIKEGTVVAAGAGGISIPTRLAHPNAAKVFLNWLLTSEGLSFFARSYGTLNMRIDSPVEGINPVFHFQPGEKTYFHSEEKARSDGAWARLSKQIIDDASK